MKKRDRREHWFLKCEEAVLGLMILLLGALLFAIPDHLLPQGIWDVISWSFLIAAVAQGIWLVFCCYKYCKLR
jgi:hypothetical protein